MYVPQAGVGVRRGRNILLREKATLKWWKFWQITFSIDYNLYWKMSIDKGKFINYDLYFIYYYYFLAIFQQKSRLYVKLCV